MEFFVSGRTEDEPYSFEHRVVSQQPYCVYCIPDRGRRPLAVLRLRDPYPFSYDEVTLISNVDGYSKHFTCNLCGGIAICVHVLARSSAPGTSGEAGENYALLYLDLESMNLVRLRLDREIPVSPCASRMVEIRRGRILFHRDGSTECYSIAVDEEALNSALASRTSAFGEERRPLTSIHEISQEIPCTVSPVSPMPHALRSTELLRVGRSAWFVGGEKEGTLTNEIVVYTPAVRGRGPRKKESGLSTPEWSVLQKQPFAPHSMQATLLFEGFLILFGGYSVHRTMDINKMFICDIASGNWSHVRVSNGPHCDFWDSILCVHVPGHDASGGSAPVSLEDSRPEIPHLFVFGGQGQRSVFQVPVIDLLWGIEDHRVFCAFAAKMVRLYQGRALHRFSGAQCSATSDPDDKAGNGAATADATVCGAVHAAADKEGGAASPVLPALAEVVDVRAFVRKIVARRRGGAEALRTEPDDTLSWTFRTGSLRA